ncbi:hypothetical protein M2396_002575 [Pseudomonas sp. BIGb0278]|jgi:hypothetical protein|uniref:Uncharacterized protein n=1 Tax=Pseudomonas fluorescens TaxID=294 RepID=A0A5E6Q442_PSEFL|nr:MULTISPECIES: hypothetical protein [Pseudomonas]MBA1196961.1 hypothetical protein [Pseudomonas plecoglossicida]MBA1320691.1 hypothetical protein [Pseudomonas plecoglossicida]MCS4284279.1 hypothetical protein [Pseudomonas sp. BIGb0278]QYX53100.1 hypothetical protein K3F44_01950 [Pseudomonas sp. S07E 245]RZI88159.1 MAG: hypothetical protein EOP15_12090 [Pseudomonas sp.]
MKLDKPAAIARRNQALARPVLTSDNCLFAILDPKRNLWWFDIPMRLLVKGQPDWVNLLLHSPESDELQHLKVPINYLRAHQEQLEVRNAGKRRSTISLALSADRDSLLRDTRPGGEQLDFRTFVQD